MAKVVVGGASGFIGTALTKALQSKGYGVISVSRTPSSRSAISWESVAVNGIPECTAVINLAGENILNPLRRWSNALANDLYNSRINTTKALAEAINKAPVKPKVFICASAIGIYPPSESARYTEHNAPPASDFTTRLCHDWELAGKLQENVDVRHAIVRIGVVLGREGGVIQRSYWPFYFGLGGRIGSGSQFFPWIHVDDLMGIFLHLMENENATGVFNGVAPNCCTNGDFTKAFAMAMWRPALFPVPEFVINMVFGSERGKVITQGQYVIPEKVVESGYHFKYPNIESATEQLVN